MGILQETLRSKLDGFRTVIKSQVSEVEGAVETTKSDQAILREVKTKLCWTENPLVFK